MSGGGLDGAAVVVTGAARGLGESATLALAGAGASLWLLDSLGPELGDVAERAAAGGARSVRWLATDLGGREGCDAGLRFIRRGVGPDLSALIHCAGVLVDQRIERTTDSAWERMLAVNVTAAFRLIRGLLPRLRCGNGGSIVLVSSRAGARGFARETGYCASKFAVEGLAQAVAAELDGAPVSANTLTPGARIKPTGMSRYAEARLGPEQRTWSSSTPLGAAFVALARLRGTPTGRRFRADRIVSACGNGLPLEPADWSRLAE